MKVLAILNDGFEDLEANGTIIILRRAGYEVTVISDSSSVKSKYTTYTNLKTFNDISFGDYDLLFLPGGGYTPSEKTNDAIKYFIENNKYVAAICSAPTYLGKLGYLKNRQYVCFPSMNEDFGGTYVDTYVVYDNKVFTARSVSSAMKLPFKILEVIDGTEKVKQVKKQMEYKQEDII
ncbi:MAG: DJ-1/PfpI family protein [Bacilli bacterium]|nr:DJ-1/PfpI family protein [Bacilli bacterium]